MIVPPGVMSVDPDEAVALEKVNVPWLGAEDCDQVKVWLLLLSLT